MASEPRDIMRAQYARIADLEAQLAAARADADALASSLDDLMDWQNGPPLVTYEEGWTEAMAGGKAALAAHESLKAGGLWR